MTRVSRAALSSLPIVAGRWPTQFYLPLSERAYAMLERLRSRNLRGTRYVRERVTTLRVCLLKIGAVVTRNTRRIRSLMSNRYPDQVLYAKVMRKLISG